MGEVLSRVLLSEACVLNIHSGKQIVFIKSLKTCIPFHYAITFLGVYCKEIARKSDHIFKNVCHVVCIRENLKIN